MNLEKFLSAVNIPPFQKVCRKKAAGVVVLSYQPKIRNNIGDEEPPRKILASQFHTEYIAFLRIIKDNPGLTFEELYEEGIKRYGFPNSEIFMRIYRGVLKSFEEIGVVQMRED